jgi:hypothetical protein
MNEGSARPERTLKEHCDRRFSQMKQYRQPLDSVYYEIATLAQPSRSRFITNGKQAQAGKRAKAHRLYDGHSITAFRILAGGMTSGLSSPSRPWFRRTLEDEDLMKFHPVQEWLAEVDRITYDFLARTNFYTAVKTGYAELGLFGTECMFMDEHWKRGMVFHSLTAGEYYLANGDDDTPDTMVRHCPMTVRQVVMRFVADRFDSTKMDWSKVSPNVKNAWDQSNDEMTVEVLHMVEPNPAYDPRRGDADGKPWRSVWWEPANSNREAQPLHVSGYHEQPFVGPRWETAGGDVYGTGPGWDALSDMRELQLQAKRLEDVMEMGAKPPTIGPAGVRVKMIPGAHTTAAAVDMAQVKPLYEVDPRWHEMGRENLQRLYGKIDDSAFASTFMAITNMDGVQPRNVEEIFARNEEKMTQLGPVVERVTTEKLNIILDRVFYSLLRRGAFPPIPEELHGKELTTEIISTLAQAQRMIGLSQTERVMGFSGNLAAAYPEVIDNFDPDEVVRDYADRAGSSPKIMRDQKDVEAIREDRAQKANTERMAAMMPAVKDGASAAQLLSETPVGDGEPQLLNQLLGA